MKRIKSAATTDPATIAPFGLTVLVELSSCGASAAVVVVVVVVVVVALIAGTAGLAPGGTPADDGEERVGGAVKIISGKSSSVLVSLERSIGKGFLGVRLELSAFEELPLPVGAVGAVTAGVSVGGAVVMVVVAVVVVVADVVRIVDVVTLVCVVTVRVVNVQVEVVIVVVGGVVVSIVQTRP